MNWTVFFAVIVVVAALALWVWALAAVPEWIDSRWGYPWGGVFMAASTALIIAVLLGLVIPETP